MCAEVGKELKWYEIGKDRMHTGTSIDDEGKGRNVRDEPRRTSVETQQLLISSRGS